MAEVRAERWVNGLGQKRWRAYVGDEFAAVNPRSGATGWVTSSVMENPYEWWEPQVFRSERQALRAARRHAKDLAAGEWLLSPEQEVS